MLQSHKKTEDTMILTTRPGRPPVGVTLLAISCAMLGFYFQKGGKHPGADAFLLLFTAGFFGLSFFCLLTWTRSTFKQGSRELFQETWLFGLIRRETSTPIDFISIRQAEMVWPHFIVFCGGEGIEEYGVIIKLGLKKKKAQQLAQQISLLCDIENRAPLPTEKSIAEKKADKELSHLDDEYHIVDGEEEDDVK